MNLFEKLIKKRGLFSASWAILLVSCAPEPRCIDELQDLKEDVGIVELIAITSEKNPSSFDRGLGLTFVSSKCGTPVRRIYYSRQTFDKLIDIGEGYPYRKRTEEHIYLGNFEIIQFDDRRFGRSSFIIDIIDHKEMKNPI